MKLVTRFSLVIMFSLLAGTVFAQQSDRDRGIDLYREGKFSEAVSVLEAAVTANENDRTAWTYLGGAYVHVGEEGKASKAFGRTRGIKQAVSPVLYEKTVKVTYKPRARYTDQARANLSSGTVRVAVEFRADGTIGFAFPLPTTTDRSLVANSVAAAKGIQFEPAIKDGKPVTVINMVEYGFQIG